MVSYIARFVGSEDVESKLFASTLRSAKTEASEFARKRGKGELLVYERTEGPPRLIARRDVHVFDMGKWVEVAS